MKGRRLSILAAVLLSVFFALKPVHMYVIWDGITEDGHGCGGGEESFYLQIGWWRGPDLSEQTYRWISGAQQFLCSLLLLLAVLGLSRLAVRQWRSRRVRRRVAAGLCASCGYDLRASAERCPECGTPFVAGQR